MHLSVVAANAALNAPPIPDAETDASDAELLAELIGHGAPPREARVRARAVLDLAGGLRGVTRAGASVLAGAGLSEESIRLVRAALALGARAVVAPAPTAPLTAAAVVEMLRPLIVHLQHEELHAVFLDAQGRYLGRRRLASGGFAACSVFVKDALAPAVESRAGGLVLVHNHPSGKCAPSPEDAALSTRVQMGADVVGIRLVDHLVVAEDGHASAMPEGARWAPSSRVRARSA